MTVLATLKDGRIIAQASFTAKWVAAGSTGFITATVSDLRTAEAVLGINLTGTTGQSISPYLGPWTAGNVVGLSVYVGTAPGGATGTSVGGTVQVVGF